jgi:hypothetical protein
MVTGSMGSGKRNIAHAGRLDVSACDCIDTGIDSARVVPNLIEE